MNAITKKILLVDDNQLFLKMLSQAFKKAGFDCMTAESGIEALHILKTNIPDAVLSDYEMPGMNGMQFRQELLADAKLKDIPFIFLTHISDNELMVIGLGLQAVDYVLKDTPVNVIVSKLNNIIYTVQKQHEISKNELKKAAEALNVRSIPQSVPLINGFEINFWHQPYRDIPGGDFIDFIQADERHTFIVLGDIMGKKWMAWFFTFSFLSYVRAAVRFGALSGDYSVASILRKVNEVICLDDVLKDMLSSLSLVMIDSETQQISYSGAGDLPLLYFNAKTAVTKQISSDGLLLGLFPDGRFSEQQISLENNDRLFIFTDGMTDLSAGSGKKSDYKQFTNSLSPLLECDYTFESLKYKLFESSADLRVDDCSIIQIRKTS
ncbi:MAG: SpoIIE family protein phosphatase [Mucilaginibacter sp.]